jgi:hypothetical protein
MIGENERRLQEAIARDFKTASSEYVFETAAELLEVEYQKSQLRSWMEPVEAAVRAFCAPAATRRWSTATRTAWHSSWVRSTDH